MWVGALCQGNRRNIPAVLILEILERKYKLNTYLYTNVNSLVQAFLSSYWVDFGIRLKVRLCTVVQAFLSSYWVDFGIRLKVRLCTLIGSM